MKRTVVTATDSVTVNHSLPFKQILLINGPKAFDTFLLSLLLAPRIHLLDEPFRRGPS